MRSRRHSPESEDHGIDLAPMLDFCVNLLIFFIITTSFIKEAGVDVYKPKAVTAADDDSGNLQIAIRENGDIWMERQHVDLREIRTRMERLHFERPDDSVVIVADRASKAGVVAKVMDEVRLSGVKVISIAADPNGG
jgi:biopolymer transport protein ExbD